MRSLSFTSRDIANIVHCSTFDTQVKADFFMVLERMGKSPAAAMLDIFNTCITSYFTVTSDEYWHIYSEEDDIRIGMPAYFREFAFVTRIHGVYDFLIHVIEPHGRLGVVPFEHQLSSYEIVGYEDYVAAICAHHPEELRRQGLTNTTSVFGHIAQEIEDLCLGPCTGRDRSALFLLLGDTLVVFVN